jgi:predicted ATPase/DNA-binding winged helix-turn-helix (wHTH) protein
MHPVYRFGPFRLESDVRSLTRDGHPTGLGARAVGVLQVLVERSNQYVSKAELLDTAWPGVIVEEANLAVQMSAIRRVLAQGPAEVCIETLSRRGYRLVGTVTVDRGTENRANPERTIPVARAGVPAERDPFVGRRAELSGLAQQWLGGARLVTVIGTGGSGKTRLACRYALDHPDAWPGGAWFCDLSEARTRDGICFAVGSALGVPVTGQDAAASLEHAIAGLGRCLLILDNFEQVAAFASSTLGRWLERAALASFLVTSRERLRIAGETLFPLEPLPLETDAVELFTVRAQAQRPELPLDVNGTDAVRRIVTLVDGLPLAIELAAARVRVMSLGQIAERMSDSLRVLVGARGSDRQATMRAAIDWSWNLLAPWEQGALAMCSVFEGEFTLRAAEAVVDLSQWPDAPPMADVIESLIDKSVLRMSIRDLGGGPGAEEPCFALYRSIAEYASGRLDGLGADVRRLAEERHGCHFATYRPEASTPTATADEQIRQRRARARALDNLAAAFRRAAARGDLETMIPTYRAISDVLEDRGPVAIAVELGAQLPPLTPDADDLLVSGHLSHAQSLRLAGRPDVAIGLLHTIIDLAREHGNRRHEGIAHNMLAMTLRNTARPAEAVAHFECAVRLLREVGDRVVLARILNNLGNVYLDDARWEQAREHYQAALEVLAAVGNVGDRHQPMCNLANIAMNTGDFDEAHRLFTEALELARRVDDRRTEGVLLSNLGYVAQVSGRPEEALELFEAALLVQRQVGERYIEGRILDNIAELRIACGDHEQAIPYLEAAREIALQTGDPELDGLVLAGLGLVHDRRRQLDQARTHLERAVEIFRSIPNRRSEGMTLGGLATVLARLGMLDEARTTFASGAELLREANDPPELGKLLCAHARAERDAGEREKALALVDEAQRLADHLRSQGGSALGTEIDELRKSI